MPLHWTETVPADSKMGPLLAKAESISDNPVVTKSAMTDGYRPFSMDGIGRQAGGVEFSAMEQLTCMELYLGAKSKLTNMGDAMVSICYRPPDQQAF
ncbi:hypothetical protein WISP_55532 [Willisornis vidua]|uniref:Uncharacterized protein n=1 Tax=Willisornis vidua TaxID=1566151 RepID=A0ABQ9DF46_9PASS|nr:hypothetical protein WISP_55532 [Willisornis vidua]